MIGFLLGLTNLLVPGLAYGLLRQRRAMWIAVALVAVTMTSFAFTPWTMFVWIGLIIAMVIDITLRYGRLKGRIAWSWLDPILAFVALVSIAITNRTLVVESFKIPASSMIPTLEIGDHIFVNKLASPARGDVIVFKHPCMPERHWIKRAIAFGGETIEVRCGVVYVNGTAISQQLVNADHTYQDVSDYPPEKFDVKARLVYERYGGHGYGVLLEHSSLAAPGESPKDFPAADTPAATCADQTEGQPAPNQQPGEIVESGKPADACAPYRRYRVPPGHVFVLGDNRPNSNDSRYWGSVPVANITGVATGVWEPLDRTGAID